MTSADTTTPQYARRLVASALVRHRDQRHLTNHDIVEQLATAGTPMSEPTLSRIMRESQIPTMHQLTCIARVMGIELKDVFA